MAKKESKGYYVLGEANVTLYKSLGRLPKSHWMDQFVHYVNKLHPQPHSFDWSEAHRLYKTGMHHTDAARRYVEKRFGGIEKETLTALNRRAIGKVKVKLAKMHEDAYLSELQVPPAVVSAGVGMIDDVAIAAQSLYSAKKKGQQKAQQQPQSGVAPTAPTRSVKYPVRAGSRPLHPVPQQQMEAVRHHKKKKDEDPLNPHGSFAHQEKVLDAWRKHHKKAIYGGLALGTAALGLASAYDTWNITRSMGEEKDAKHIIDYAGKLKRKTKHFYKTHEHDIHHFLDTAVRAVSEDNTTLGSTDTVSDEDERPSKGKKKSFGNKKDDSSSTTEKVGKKMTIVYKKGDKKDEFEVPKKDLKGPINNNNNQEPDSTTDDPETDDRRQDVDHHKHETSPDKLPTKHHPHFSAKDAHNGDDETSEPHHGQPTDKKQKVNDSPDNMPSKGENRMDAQENDDEESDQPIDRGTRNGEEYDDKPPEHTLKKDKETGEVVEPENDEPGEEQEADAKGDGSSTQQADSMSKAKKLRDLYKKDRTSGKDDNNNEQQNDDETGEEDQAQTSGKPSQTNSLPADNNGNATDMSDGDETGHNEEDEAESTEDEPIGKPEKINFRPTMDAITTQANGV